MNTMTIKAQQLDAGSVVILPSGARRTVAAADDTATHVYLDFTDGGSGIYPLNAVVTVERDTPVTAQDVPAFTPVAPVRPAILHTDFSSPAGLASFTHNR